MPTTKSNLTQTPVNADTFNLTGDLGTMAESITSVVSVANQAAGDTVATARAAAGFAVTDARPLFCWDQSQNALIVKGTAGWRGGIRPFGHMGRTAGFQTLSAGGSIIIMDAAQVLRGGMTFDNASDALVAPIAGVYRISILGMFSGATGNVNITVAWKNSAAVNAGGVGSCDKVDGNDVRNYATAVVTLAAGDKIGLFQNANAQAWGTTGYDGSYLELEYMDQW